MGSNRVQKTIPYIGDTKIEGLNFPININTYRYPTIGELGLDGKPIKFNETEDSRTFLRIKGLEAQEEYTQVIYSADDFVDKYPNSIFKKEVLLIKIRAMRKIYSKDKLEDIVEEGREWIKKYSSDSGMAEVLFIVAKTYDDIGFFREALYYYDRLFTEHPGNKFNVLGKIVYADRYFAAGNTDKTIEIYMEALSEAKDLDTASQVGIKFSKVYIKMKKYDEAYKLLDKIIKANPNYFKREIDTEQLPFIDYLVNNKQKEVGARIAEIILPLLQKNRDLYYEYMKNIAVWYDEIGNKVKAREYYTRYLSNTVDLTYKDLARKNLDSIIFDKEEKDYLKRVAKLKELIKNYANDKDIRDRAYQELVALLYHNKKYEKVLGYKDVLPKDNEYVKNSAKALALKELIAKNCDKSFDMQKKYNVIPDENYDKEMYYCYKKYEMYPEIEEISKTMISDKDINVRVEWLYRYINAKYKQDKFREVINLGNNFLDLTNSIDVKKYDDILYDMFYSAYNLDKTSGNVVTYAQKIAARFRNDPKSLMVYRDMIEYGKLKGDKLTIENYAKKIIELQERLGVDTYTPWVYIIYGNKLRERGKFQEALEVVSNMASSEIKASDKVEVLYLMAASYEGMNDLRNAEKYYIQCSKIEGEYPWKNLCKENLQFFKKELQ